MDKKVFFGTSLAVATGVGLLGKVAWDESNQTTREYEQNDRQAYVEAHAALRGYRNPEVIELSKDDEGIYDAELHFDAESLAIQGGFCFISYAKSPEDNGVAEKIDFKNCD